MTYCLAINVDEGLVFASDSRTNAGADQVSTYSKMHLFGVDGERQIVVLSAGNLATTQAVVAQLRRDIDKNAPISLRTVRDLSEAAEYLGEISRVRGANHKEAVAQAGFNPEATFIVGGQIGTEAPQIYLVYPQGNYITTSAKTRFFQIGEIKYGKPILDRVISAATSLESAARCAVVSLDSTVRSNATVGPPIEILRYETDSLRLEQYLCLQEDDPYQLQVKKDWNQALIRAFDVLPQIRWRSVQTKSECG